MLQGRGYLYVSLYNGNIIVLIDRGDTGSVSLQSDRLYLSDAAVHSVSLDLTMSTRYKIYFISQTTKHGSTIMKKILIRVSWVRRSQCVDDNNPEQEIPIIHRRL